MIINPYVVLIRCIAVLYLSNKVPGNWTDVRRIIAETIQNTELPLSSLGDGSDGMVAYNLRNLIEWMLNTESTVIYDKDDLMSRVRINLKEEPEYVAELESAISVEINEERARNRIHAIISELKYELRKQNISKLVSKINHRINYSKDIVDYKESLDELQQGLSKYSVDLEGGEKGGFVGRLSSDSTTEMAKIFEKAKEINSTEGVLKTGLVGLNRGCGVGGLRRGELINFGALTHNYKTGILNDLVRHVALHNVPWMWDKNKKPMVLRVSFENKLEQDLPIIYKALVEQATGEKISITEIDPITAAKYVKSKLEVNGYTFAMECYNPNDFDVFDLIDLINRYEAKGYEIHLLAVDYMELIASKGRKERGDEAINSAFETIRNHCFPRGITLVTAHQLSTQALDILRESSHGFAKRIAGGNYYRNTRSLANILDLEWILHIEIINDIKYLTFARGKHRGGEHTPIKNLSFAYRFQDVGGVVDDILFDVPTVIYDLNKYTASLDDNGLPIGVSSSLDMEAPEAW